MIKVGVLAGDGRYYERDLSPGAYYGAAASGVAAGGAAAEAGLRDAVTAAETDNLLAGRSADGGRELVRPHPKRKQGCELHTAPDKSVSALFAAAPLVVAWAIVAASEAALRLALRQAEAECGVTRRGKAGLVRELGKLVFAIYTHITSRAGDPQLHHHVVVPNLVLRPDGTWGAHHNRLLYKAQKRLTATYNRALRDNLVSLGIDARLENGRCVVAGVPKSLCEAFSTRRKEVVAAKGEFHPKDREAAQKAAWATRGRKARTPETELREQWRAVAEAHGYDPAASVVRVPTVDQVEAVRRAAEAAYPGSGRVSPATPTTPAARVPAAAASPANSEPTQARTEAQTQRAAGGAPRPRPGAQEKTRQEGQATTAAPAPETRAKRPEPDTPSRNIAAPKPAKVESGSQPVTVSPPPPVKPPAQTAAGDARRERDAGPTALARAAESAARKDFPLRRTPERLARRAVKRAVADLAQTFAHFGPDQIEAHAVALLKAWERLGLGSEQETAPALFAALQDLRDRPKVYGLTALPNDAGFATARQWKVEQAVTRDLRRLAHGRAREAPPPSAVLRGLARPDLTPEQKGAVTGVVCTPSRLALVDGVGRSGKTAVAREVCGAFARAGREVYAVAGTARGAAALVAGTATRQLTVTDFNLLTRRPGVVETWKHVFRATRGKRFKSPAHLARYAEAVHRRLKAPPVALGRNSVVVVDDAHRVATADLAPLLRRARKAGAKVVLLGDSKGPLPARPAGTFAHAVLTRPAATLGPPHPAADPAVREAARHLAHGRGDQAVQALRAGGGLTAADRPRTRLLADYRRGGHLERPEGAAVLTATEREARAVNRSVQRLRRAGGHLGTRAVGDGCHVSVGDRVVVTRSDRRAGVAAHALGTLVAVGPTRHRVRLDGGQTVAVPAKNPPLRLAYALGPSAAAGHAFERAFVLLGPHRGEGRVTRLPNRDQALAMLARVSGRAVAFARPKDLAGGKLASALGRRGRPGMAIDAAEAAQQRARTSALRPEQTQQPGY